MQDQFESATQEAGAKAKAGAEAVRDEARRTAEDVQEQLAGAAASAKEQLGGMANRSRRRRARWPTTRRPPARSS